MTVKSKIIHPDEVVIHLKCSMARSWWRLRSSSSRAPPRQLWPFFRSRSRPHNNCEWDLVEKRGYGYGQNAAEEYNCCSKRNYTFGARLVTSAFLPKTDHLRWHRPSEKKFNCDDCGRFSEKTAISRTAFLKQNTDRREKRRKLVQNRGKNIVTIIDLKTKVGMYHFLQNCSTVYGKNHGDRRLMPHTAVSKMTSFCTLRFHLHQHLN
jgi:hypothetical protein